MIRDLRPTDPASVGPYRLLARLGVGGMGLVYLAKSPGGRLVAIKLIRPELAEERGFRARFAGEIAAARNVSGIYTAVVIDADAEAEQPWMATAYVPGPSLADAVADDGPLPVGSLLSLAAGLAEALAAIHAAGLVHRDLKPSNVLLAADGPRVIDFGISRAIERSMLTTTGAVLGSPGFMSPEQARGQREVGPAADVFSLGAVLAFAATGEGPFGGGQTPALLYRVVNEEPNLVQVPQRLRPLIERCLAKDPADRPSPADLLAEISGEAGPLTGDWLPPTIAEAIHRYVPTIQTPPHPVSAVPPEATGSPIPPEPVVAAADGPAEQPAAPQEREGPELEPAADGPELTSVAADPQEPAEPGDTTTVSGPAHPVLADAGTAIAAGAAEPDGPTTHAVQAVEPAGPEPELEPVTEAPAAAVAGSAPELERDPVTAGGDTLPPVPLSSPASAPDRRRRRRWPVGAAAAVVTIGAVIGIVVSLSPGTTPKVVAGPSGPVPTVVVSTAHVSATTRSPSPAPSRKPSSKASKKPGKKSTPKPTNRIVSPQTSATTYSPPSATTPAVTPPAATPPAATTPPATHPPSGPQSIASVSGASEVGCQEYGSVGSASGGAGVSYGFVNNSGADIQVWYLTSGGSGQLEATVGPGGSAGPAVATGQYWMVANSGGGCLVILHISGSGQVTVS